jgi:transcriptional regulator with XRE-family HTH domain
MDLRPIFAHNLRRLRLARGLSQFDVAFRANIDPSYIGRIERTTTGAGIDIIGRLVDVLEIEPAELFYLTRDQAARARAAMRRR